ncbi:SAVED domain-containing protein [Yersinia enterocolitica]|uniref:SAVED domain-containing protein n=1 Tax=Yersinia TaxID=629 RepID=UPI000173993F|nr:MULTISPECIES: SAVED domain-containing protein [Yersinia]ELM3738352.1 SAVED domain-containing protein [Yersinia ruckeri]CQD56487.1 Uncharacterised protein [Yersinia intermedia]AJJ02217.1 hypothetical protein BZ21_3154 [Yersinia pseudotuberculosis]AJJ67847.1 hypothetical protein BZ16_3267 [Yersinia pseudotuberculosis PB1/+]AYX16496.1 SAVED domain-containing protein [Yersinia pseudotuberculosis]
MKNNDMDFLNQAINDPIDKASIVSEFICLIKKHIIWDDVGLLTDQNNNNLIILLLKKDEVLSSMRFNLNIIDSINIIESFSENGKNIILRVWQGNSITQEHLKSLACIQNVWQCTYGQSSKLTKTQVVEFFNRIDSERLVKGRGKKFSAETIRKVMCDSHSRCMFPGCGEQLNIDMLSGQVGNFSYLAHNVAASEQGERGIPLLSSLLSDEPENILLLCDKHHRLIDRVAACDYTAEKLSIIRKNFMLEVSHLLDGLCYQPIPVYSILWPVNSNVVASPESREIASSLSFLKLCMKGQLNHLSDCEGLLRSNPQLFGQMITQIIKDEAEKIIQQTKHHGYKAALFAFGPTPALIGLGAILGNKGQYIPMLRYRDGNCWMWPKNMPVRDFYNIIGMESLESNSDFIICINFTAKTKAIEEKAIQLSEKFKVNIINIDAKPEFLGNGAIPHPQDGMSFSAKLQTIFHQLKSKYNAERIHLLVCASNAASIFIGQAYDLHHPEIIVYDFTANGMETKLVIKNNSDKTELYLP